MTGRDGRPSRTMADWLRDLAAQGVELWFEGDRLRFRAPKGALGPEERAELAARRAEILAQLRAEAAATERTYPLSFSQQSLWFLHQQVPDSTAYHVALSARVLSPVDEGALRHALQALSDRHAILRTTYAYRDDAPCQRVAGAVPGLPEPALRAAVEADLRRPFDLERGPVLRASLYTRGAEDHVLLVTVHHIAADGWSLMMLMGELLKLYEEATGGAPAGLARPALQYADYAAWQEKMLAGPEGERLWSYWRERLTPPPPPLELPADHVRPAIQTFRGASLPFQLGQEPTQRLKALARQEGTTAFVVLLASFHALLYRLTGAEDIVVGTPTFARSKPEFMPVVGDFVNSVPLRARVAPSTTFRALVAQLRDTVLQALDAQEFPFPLLVQRLQPERNSGRSPLFDAFFVLQRFDQVKGFQELITGGGNDAPIEAGGLRLASYPVPQQEGQFDLDLRAGERDGVLYGVFNYSTDLFDEATVRGFTADYLALADAVGRDPDIALGSVDEVLRAAGAGADETGDADGPRPVSRDRPLPVSVVQQRLWSQDRVDRGLALHNAGGGLHLYGPLDVEALRRALDELERRHESLRTRIVELGGAPTAEVLAPAGIRLEVIDLGSVPAEQRQAEARRLADACVQMPFDLARGPLAAYRLVRLAPDEHVLAVGAHRVVVDDGSIQVVLRDLCLIYEAFAAGRPSPLAPLPLQAVDLAAWERARLRSGRGGRQLAHWKRELAGAPGVLELPTDRPRPAAPSHRNRPLRRPLDPRLLEALEEVGRASDATLFMTLLAAFQVLLYRYSGQDDLVVGSAVANRDHPALDDVVGCFAHDLVLRARLAGNPAFSEFLSQVRRTTLVALEHGDTPFDVPVQVLFALRPRAPGLAGPAGLRVEPVDPPETGRSRLDLSLVIDGSGGQLVAHYEYALDLFDEDSIVRMHGHLERLLRSIVADPSTSVDDLPILGTEDERILLSAGTDTALEHDRTRCVHQWLETQARATPDAIAVISGASRHTYRELDERANRLARLLGRRGVTPGSLVAVCVDRTWDMPVAVAGVLKAGAAYVPLDPTHPVDRLRYTLEDASVACAITLRRFAHLLGDAGTPLVLLDEVEAELAALPATSPGVQVDPEDRAYVIYTSGSTGRPKGVEVEHRNMVAFLEAMRREPGLGEKDVLLAVTTLSFDIAGLELWLPLGVGARVVIASRADTGDADRLRALLQAHGVTVMQATPATWRMLLDAGWAGAPGLKVLCGGEALPRDLAAALTARVGELWNVYGPTETTVWSTVCRVDDVAGPITIGHPIANTRVYVLERSGQLAPVGVPGELCIGGEGVARGYRNRPELTAERFTSVILPGGHVDRIYRTGDVARFRGDGRIDFLGRRDHQVKVRGFRIELGEIESVLGTHPGIRHAIVVAREPAAGDVRLVAYVVHEPGTDPAVGELRSHLHKQLPDYMIPSMFVTLGAMPLTPNGKVDRAALPDPFQGAARASAEHVPPAAGVEQALADIWRETLKVERVGARDNFFELGGHSLLATRVLARIEQRLGVRLSLRDVFESPTIQRQSEKVDAARREAGKGGTPGEEDREDLEF
jgi:amino acid adenylation domain-containing protein